MKKIHTISIFAVLVIAVSFSIHEVYATTTPLVTVLPPSPPGVPVGGIATVLGSGFLPGQIYVFLDNTNVDSQTVLDDGIINISFLIPTSTTPGPHTITISSDPNSINALALPISITVTEASSIPEFPFSFSLVIIFVVVTATYLVIRQKMTTNFKHY
jgi:hypothetical protein